MESNDEDEKVVIYPIESHKTMLDYYNAMLPKMIPKIPLSLLLCGPRQSGKTTTLINLIYHYYSRVYKYHQIYLFSPSVFLDPQYNMIDCKKYEDFDSDLVQKLLNDLKYTIKNYGKDRTPRVLFIFDDIISDPNAHNSYSLISSLFIKGRHYNADVIIATQSLTMISPVIRKNSLQIILYNTQENEREILLKEFASRGSKKEYYNMLMKVFNEPYNSLYINTQAHTKDKKYIKNFQEFISY